MQSPKPFDPYSSKQDRMFFNNHMGNRLVFHLQRHLRIMPVTLVSTISLLHRKGVSEETLQKQVAWLGMACKQRGAVLANSGLSDVTQVQIGLRHLQDYLVKKRDVLMPKVGTAAAQGADNSSFIMLNYYRNPLNHLFFNESLIVASMLSFGSESTWTQGVNIEELYQRTCYLADLLKREEVLEHRISSDSQGSKVFNQTI